MKSATHVEELVTGVGKLLSDTSHKYSDVQLKVGGKIFHCHRLILALKSPYFEKKLFPSSSSPAAAADQVQVLVLKDISADDFDKVLQFMYTGEVELTNQNVRNILRAADVIELNELTQFCGDYLLDSVSTTNCIGHWRLAEQMNLAALASSCKRLCLKEFEKIGSSTDELSSLSEKMMVELLEDNELVVESEVDVCETLMKWLNSQTQAGYTVQPRQLLTHIRWSSVPVEYVKSKLITNSQLMNDRPSFEFLSKVISYRLTGVQFNGLNTFHRPSTGVEQCVVIVGMTENERGEMSDVRRLSLQTKDKATSMQAIPTTMQIESAACVGLSGSQVYVTGIGDSNNEAWKWESVVGWTRCADMNEGRRTHCATFVNNTSMYVLGGYVDNRKKTLDSIVQYNTVTNKWTKVGQLTHAACGAACAVHKTSIYVFGGMIKNDEVLDCVQVFDTATKICTELTQRLPRPEALLRAVMWDKSVILFNLRTCLIFDIEQKTFQQRDQFAVEAVFPGLVLENQRIFVIGGSNIEDDATEEVTFNDEMKSVAVMDIINDQSTPNWIHHAKLPTSFAVLAFASMTLPG